MKKAIIGIGILFISFACISISCGIKKTLTFQEDSYKRQYSYLNVFKTITTEYDGSNYSFEQGLIEESKAKELVEKIAADKTQIEKSIPSHLVNENINVYIINDSRIVGPIVEEDGLFLPESYIQDDTYRYYMVQVMTDKGMCSDAFEDYKTAFNDKDAKEPVLFELEDKNSYEQEALSKIEIFITGDNNYIFKSEGSEFIVNTDLLDKEMYLDILDLVAEDLKTKPFLKKYLADAGIVESMYGGNVDDVHYYVENKGGLSYTKIDNDRSVNITLNSVFPRIINHELMHGFFVDYKDNNKYWMEEGFCDYVGYLLRAEDYMIDYYKDFSQDDTYDDGDFKAYYQARKDEDVDIARIYYDYVVNRVYEGKDLSNYPKLKGKISVNFKAGTNYIGLDLSYTEAMCFVAYLIDQNGVEDLFNFIRSDESYEEHYGKSYDELKSEWMDYLKI